MGGFSSDYGSSRDYSFSPTPSVTKRTARDYAKEDKREYAAPTRGITTVHGKNISTDSDYAAIFVVDVTGSMKDWPKLIFNKIPTLYSESNAAIQGLRLKDLESGKKLEDKLEMAIIAVGDMNYDNYPLQIIDFSKGSELVKGVKSIHPEGGGGPFGEESYELVAYYLDNHCKINSKKKPLLVYACDEDFYSTIHKDHVKKLFGDKIPSSLSSDTVMKRVLNKFDSYVLRPEPGAEPDNVVYKEAHEHWQKLLGGNSQKVLKMNDPSRLVDCFIGIAGYAANNFKQAEEMLRRRQTPGQVDEVLKSLHPLTSSKPARKRTIKKN
ncbi:Uncharacterised protein [uncultured archaeon]|nr:Uncharacterised protein [uncultured archaeon]